MQCVSRDSAFKILWHIFKNIFIKAFPKYFPSNSIVLFNMVGHVNFEAKHFLQDAHSKYQTKVRKMLTRPTKLNIHHWNIAPKVHSPLFVVQVLVISVAEGPKYKHITFGPKFSNIFKALFNGHLCSNFGQTRIEPKPILSSQYSQFPIFPQSHPICHNLG